MARRGNVRRFNGELLERQMAPAEQHQWPRVPRAKVQSRSAAVVMSGRGRATGIGLDAASCKAHEGQPHHSGNGQMVAFTVASREHVRATYQPSLKKGDLGSRSFFHDLSASFLQRPACKCPLIEPAAG